MANDQDDQDDGVDAEHGAVLGAGAAAAEDGNHHDEDTDNQDTRGQRVARKHSELVGLT